MPDAIASVTLSPADLVRLAAPRLLSEVPELGMVERWVIDLTHVPGKGIRFDVIAPAGDAGR